jgi:hypothetical protein
MRTTFKKGLFSLIICHEHTLIFILFLNSSTFYEHSKAIVISFHSYQLLAWFLVLWRRMKSLKLHQMNEP